MKSKRYVTIAEYQRQTGLSYQTIRRACESGELKTIKTTAGHFKIDTADTGNSPVAVIVERLDEQQQLLTALCQHLGVTAR